MKKHQHQKRILSIAALALALALLLPALSARADEIYEPYDSDFYVEHSQDCTYEEELYEINASGGVRMMAEQLLALISSCKGVDCSNLVRFLAKA